MVHWSRRRFVSAAAVPVSASVAKPWAADPAWQTRGDPAETGFAIGLSMSSLRETLRSGVLQLSDLPAFAIDKLGIQHLDVVDSTLPRRQRSMVLRQLVRSSRRANTNIWMLTSADAQRTSGDIGRRLRDVVDQANLLGARWVRLRLGSEVGSTCWQASGAPHARVVDALRRIASYADMRGIHVTLSMPHEPMLGELIQGIDHPNCFGSPVFGKRDRRVLCKPRQTRPSWTSAPMISVCTSNYKDGGLTLHGSYQRLLRSIPEANSGGVALIEYRGNAQTEIEGVFATTRLLRRLPNIGLGPSNPRYET